MLKGKDLRSQPLLKRKAVLQKLLSHGHRNRYLSHVSENGERLYQQMLALGLEGIGKRADSSYVAGRTKDWVKVKTPIGR